MANGGDPSSATREGPATGENQRQSLVLRFSISPGGAAPARPKSRLHNFTFPSASWSGQRLYRCRKADPSPTAAAAPASALDRSGGDLRGTEEAIGDIAAAEAPFRAAKSTGDDDAEPSPAAVRPEAARPWNLRKRRAACKEPLPAPEEAVNHDQGKGSPSARFFERTPRMKTTAEERTRLFRELSRAEVEEDFIFMTGSKPPRRPKKWPKAAQKHLKALSPGSYLTEITRDLYRTS